MMFNRVLLYYAAEDWANYHRQQMIFPLAAEIKQSRIFVIIVDRFLNPTDIIKKPNKVFKWLKTGGAHETLAENLVLFNPWIFLHDRLANRIKAVQSANKWIARKQLNRFLRKMGFQDLPIISWIVSPNYLEFQRLFGDEFSVSEWFDIRSIGLDGKPIQNWPELEREVFEKSDLIFVTSQPLRKRAEPYNENVHQLKNGIDFDRFSRATTEQLGKIQELEDMTRPIVGHVGHLRTLTDFKTLDFVISNNKNVSFVSIGRLHSNCKRQHRQLQKHQNYFYLGPKPFEVLPAYMQYFDVAIMVYIHNEFTEYSDALKIGQYLAAGLPVVSTFLPCTEIYQEYIQVARNEVEFNEKLQKILKELNLEHSKKMVQTRLEIASKMTWERRASKMNDILMTALKTNWR